MNQVQKISVSLTVLAFLSITISTIIDLFQAKIVEISWLASIFVVIEVLYLRYQVDDNAIAEYISSTNRLSDDLHPKRFLNWMTIAMVVGLLATVVIHFNFIAGMLTYLTMQICLIISFSGIFSLNPASYNRQGTRLPVISIGIWIIIIGIVFFLFVYNGSESLIVVPYVIFLGTMAHFTWYGLAYTDRPKLFRYLLVLGSSLFVFSDALIGNAVFGNRLFEPLFVIIDFTYVLNLLCMVNSILILQEKGLRYNMS